MFSFDQVAAITTEADRIIGLERDEWEPFYVTIENYVAKFSQFEKSASGDAGIFVGGSLGVNMLLKKPRTLSDYVYYLYSPQALHHANQLTNALAEMVAKSYGSVKDILEHANEIYKTVEQDPRQHNQLKNIREPRIVMMKTALPYQRYIIYVDTRILVQFTSLPHGAASIIKPTLAESLGFGSDSVHNAGSPNQLFVISPEVQLLDLYRVLYSPAKAGEWRDALRDENNLYQHMKRRLSELKNLKKGSADGGASPEHDAYKLHILSEWVTDNPNVVLIGDFALRLLGIADVRGTMVQVIAQTNPSECAALICSMLEKKFNIKCSQHTRPLAVMQDFRLQRTTVRAGDKEVLYIYNSGSYDFIPFNTAVSESKSSKTRVIQVGNPFVLMRFLLVDFWTVRLLNHEGKIDSNYAQLRLDGITKHLLELRSKISEVDDKVKTTSIGDKFIGEGGLFRTFPSRSEDYMGIYEDELQAQKNQLAQGARRYSDYYPDEALIRMGRYHEFGTKKEGGYIGAYDDPRFEPEDLPY